MDGVPVELTATEYRLLAVLVRHRGQVLSPVKLLELVWSDPFGVGPDRVKYSVMRLRRKLGTRRRRGLADRGGPRLRLPLPRGPAGPRYGGSRNRLAPERPPPGDRGRGTLCRSCLLQLTTLPQAAQRSPPRRGRVLLVEDDPEAALFCHAGPARSAAGSRSPTPPTRLSPSRWPPRALGPGAHRHGLAGHVRHWSCSPRSASSRPSVPVLLVTASPAGRASSLHGRPAHRRRRPDALLVKPISGRLPARRPATALHRVAS